MIAICERTSIEITLENATNYAVYALLRLFSIIDSCKKTTINTLIRVFFLLFESGRPRPLFLSARRGWRGGGATIIFSFIRRLAPFWGSKF